MATWNPVVLSPIPPTFSSCAVRTVTFLLDPHCYLFALPQAPLAPPTSQTRRSSTRTHGPRWLPSTLAPFLPPGMRHNTMPHSGAMARCAWGHRSGLPAPQASCWLGGAGSPLPGDLACCCLLACRLLPPLGSALVPPPHEAPGACPVHYSPASPLPQPAPLCVWPQSSPSPSNLPAAVHACPPARPPAGTG